MKNTTQQASDDLGLIVPINIEALCVGNKTGAIFQQAPYDFSKLPDFQEPGPYVSEKLKSGGAVAMEPGVHLHWALPDGLTKGETVPNNGNIQFPAVPDRWLVTRVYTNLKNEKVNQAKSWVIESNYMSEAMPDDRRPSVSVPYRSDNGDEQQFRYLGRVLEYETWLQKFHEGYQADAGIHVSGLTAIGYGTTDFSAFYPNCRSMFGFCDLASDLAELDKSNKGDFLLSYNVIGWYHDSLSDPLKQLPLQMYRQDLDALIARLGARLNNRTDREFVNRFYTLWPADNIYVLDTTINSDDRKKLTGIFASAGHDFLQAALARCKWSLPSGSLKNSLPPTHTLLCGQINGIRFNNEKQVDEIKSNVSIAVGNTAHEALASLIASKTDNKELPYVEFLLNALQLGELNAIKDPNELNANEKLQLAMHTSAYQSSEGGYLWQISRKKSDEQEASQVSLPNELADSLNALNGLQQAYDNTGREITALREQIFMDWYKYMLVYHPTASDPDRGMTEGDMASLIDDQIQNLYKKIDSHTTGNIDRLRDEIEARLRDIDKVYQLEQISAPRFWQPLEPVVLFQGEQITPPQRYGGDGRFMPDDTMVCRLSNQLTKSFTARAGTLGNNQARTVGKDDVPALPDSIPLDYDEVHGLFTEFNLLNPPVMAACMASTSTLGFDALVEKLTSVRNAFSEPGTPSLIPVEAFNKMQQTLDATDFAFLSSFYKEVENGYQLNVNVDELPDKDRLRLTFIFISTSRTWDAAPSFDGIAPSSVYFVDWKKNPWLPFSLSWQVNYLPYAPIDPGTTYADAFVTKQFKLGDVSIELRDSAVTVPKDSQGYSSSIFMSPHATENFQEQIQKFIDAHQGGSFEDELKAILASMKNFPPVLSQAFSGMNSAMLMRSQELQLQVKDPIAAGRFADFTNNHVRMAVDTMNRTAPAPGNYFNPIRAGLMQISSLTIVDVFGRYIPIEKPDKIIISKSLSLPGLKDNLIFLPPRIVQPSRLQFRWLAADNNAIEMNAHPATTPICGWLVANHLEKSLWIYTNDCKPLGSIILTEDKKHKKQVIWQSAPGYPGFGDHIDVYFGSGPGKTVNEELKKLVLALFNGGDGSYLETFMNVNDLTFSSIQPQNFRQVGGLAVLMGSPIAVAQARIDIELNAPPAWNQSWTSMANEVNDGTPKTDNGFMQVEFPVRLGSMKQVNDGLLGYFKDGDYDQYYSTGAKTSANGVNKPDEHEILLKLDPAHNSRIVTLLFDPRGSIHATTGVLPVKEISIPADMYADDLMNLEMAFLTAPLLVNESAIAFPVPPENDGKWSWIENQIKQWSDPVGIAPVDDRANLQDLPNVIKEGWLKLTKSK